MQNSNHIHDPLTKITVRGGVKKRMRTVVVLLLLFASLTYLSLQLVRVSSAISAWATLKEHTVGDEVDKALRVVNSEEMLSIPPMLLTTTASALAFRSVNLKIIPRQCYYCGRLVSAKKVRQPPDKSFFWCEGCEIRLRLGGQKAVVKI